MRIHGRIHRRLTGGGACQRLIKSDKDDLMVENTVGQIFRNPVGMTLLFERTGFRTHCALQIMRAFYKVPVYEHMIDFGSAPDGVT